MEKAVAKEDSSQKWQRRFHQKQHLYSNLALPYLNTKVSINFHKQQMACKQLVIHTTLSYDVPRDVGLVAAT